MAGRAGDCLSGLEIDPRRLANVEEKIGRLEALRRKYGQSVEEMLAHRDDVERELVTLEGADDRIQQIEAERKALDERMEKAQKEQQQFKDEGFGCPKDRWLGHCSGCKAKRAAAALSR